MTGKLPFIRESTPPPDIEEGQIIKATIKNLEAPVKGNYGEQVEFALALTDGFEAKAWISYYEEPSDKSKLGRLLMKLAEVTGKAYQTIPEALEALKEHGVIYVKCSGFREWEDLLLPKFTIVADKIPAKLADATPPTKTTKSPQQSKQDPTDQVPYLKSVILEAMTPNTVYSKVNLVGVAKVEDWATDALAQKAVNELLEQGKILPKFENLQLVGFQKA